MSLLHIDATLAQPVRGEWPPEPMPQAQWSGLSLPQLLRVKAEVRVREQWLDAARAAARETLTPLHHGLCLNCGSQTVEQSPQAPEQSPQTCPRCDAPLMLRSLAPGVKRLKYRSHVHVLGL